MNKFKKSCSWLVNYETVKTVTLNNNSEIIKADGINFFHITLPKI